MTAHADLAEVRAALAPVAQATSGPWRTFGRWPNLAVVSGSDRPRIVASLASASDAVDDTTKDAAAIVALRNAAPAIAAAVEELTAARAEIASAREQLDRLRSAIDEREGDMHMRIRAGYDKTVADAWRAAVAKRDAEIAALRRQVCRLVSGHAIESDSLCQHHGADVAALALLADERAAHAETARDLDALLTALGAQVTPGGQTEDACQARRVADGMRRAHAAASALPPIDAAAEKLVDGLVAANRPAAGKRTAIAKAAPDVYLAPWEAEDLLKRIGNTYDLETTAGRNRADAAMRRALDLLGARPISEWNDDMGSALWWRFPIEEPPYSGSPLDSDWPGYHTHWTPIVCPDDPQTEADADPASRGPIGRPVCSTCNDSHAMTIGDRTVMCTRCPTPCHACRAGGNGPFCGSTPCPCKCHAKIGGGS